MIKNYNYPYNWTLKHSNFTKDKGKVFSCFACGGGSTMGYKLAGFDVIGHNDIDKKMVDVYKENNNPKFTYLESITTFAKRKDLPKELYELDILDGSPPCSSFSMAGNREKDWGKEKVFREGQSEQVLDTLFFDFIDLAKELQPKVVIAENVKGLLLGNAKEYVRKIYKEFEEAGYYCQHFLLDASKMGVPQRRERVFFICLRKNLSDKFLYQQDMFTVKPKIQIEFNKEKITINDIDAEYGQELKGFALQELERYKSKKPFKYLQSCIVKKNQVFPTLTTGYRTKASPLIEDSNKWLNDKDICKIGSFPQDYNFLKLSAAYLIGMSVPPVMTAQIASQVYDQWLNKL